MTLIDHTADVQAAMSALGLTPPGTIKWTGEIERFRDPPDKKNDNGWYIAYPDAPQNVVFGTWRGRGIKGQWTSKEEPDSSIDLSEFRENNKKLEARRKIEREVKWANGAARCKKKYDAAKPAELDHPYLVKKGITDVDELRMAGDSLMVPMKSIETHKFVSVQYIPPDGKEKRFGKDTHVHAARTTIGADAFKNTNILYLTEGWATGWTIHHVTGDAVVVAFSAGNLMPVAEGLRKKYPKATIIIAADNDRWTLSHGEHNPGVTAAQKAVEATTSLIAVPDFESLDTKPTDFNDLWLLQGDDAVKYWLDPANAASATITDPNQAPPMPAAGEGPTLDPSTENEDDGGPWFDTAPFRCLGYDRGTYWYLPRGTGQIHGLTGGSHLKIPLLALAPLRWWESTFPSKMGADWLTAADALLRASERSGVFRPERLRGRGCWNDRKGLILHLGDRILPPGESRYVDPETFRCSRGLIYERQPHINGPSTERMMDLPEAMSVLGMFRDLLWHEPSSAVLAAGWTVLGPVCGALMWRPHIWITGGTGSGKSTVLERLMLPLLGGPYDEGGMNRSYDGGTTEAGIRQGIRHDALPVLYDELEKVDQRSDARVQSVLSLARSASSTAGAHTAKGTIHGQAMSFQVRSMFCLASIGGAVRQEADKTRVCLLQLKAKDTVAKEERKAHWDDYEPRLRRITAETGSLLMARTVGWLRDGRLAETLKVFQSAASVQLGDARSGDQYGTLYAGAWVLMSDEPPGEQEAREFLGTENLEAYVQEQVPEGRKALTILLQCRERIDTSSGPKTVAVGQLVDACVGRVSPVSEGEASAFLKQIGMRVDSINGEWALVVATQSEWVKNALRNTPYGDSIHLTLRTLRGVTPGGRVRFLAGFVSHSTVIPLAVFDDE